MTHGAAELGASFSRAPSIAALPEAATPKSSAKVEAFAVIIGITNRVNVVSEVSQKLQKKKG